MTETSMNCFNNIYGARIILRRTLLTALCISSLAIFSLLAPSQAISAQEEKVSLNFVNAEIEEVIKAVSHITGKNFVVSTGEVPAQAVLPIHTAARRYG